MIIRAMIEQHRDIATLSESNLFRILRNEEQSIILHGLISEPRTLLIKIFLEEGASLSLRGRFRVAAHAAFTLEIVLVHEGNLSTSRIDVRAVVYDSARMISIGRVHVPPTRGVDSAQYARILLVGERSSGRAEPIIEVEAQDVVCKHGSAVAPIPSEEIILLRARGIPASRARELFVDAFLAQ